MKSSFQKKIKSGDQFQSSGNIFFGLPYFDAILDNSLKKGTLIVMEEDYPTKIHTQFIRYYLGSGVQLNQQVIIYDYEVINWRNIVPDKMVIKNIKEEKKNEKEEEDVLINFQNLISQHKIAWRYNKLKQVENTLPVSQNAPKIDLSKNMQEESVDNSKLEILNLEQFSNLQELFENICNTYSNCLKSSKDTSLKKICIRNLLNKFNPEQTVELAQFLHALRVFLKASHSLILLSIPTNCNSKTKYLFKKSADLYFQIEQIFGGKEFEDFQGLLKFQKLPIYQNYTAFCLETLTWGLKLNDKKEIVIEKLYINPTFDNV